MPMTDAEFENYINSCAEKLEVKQAELNRDYGLGLHGKFKIDFEKGTLSFTNKEDVPVIVAEMVPIFSHVPDKKHLKWAWANQQFPEQIRARARKATELYEITGMEVFNHEMVGYDEDMAWQIAAMVCDHFSALGAYRAPGRSLQSNVTVNSHVLITAIKRIPAAGD